MKSYQWVLIQYKFLKMVTGKSRQAKEIHAAGEFFDSNLMITGDW